MHPASASFLGDRIAGNRALGAGHGTADLFAGGGLVAARTAAEEPEPAFRLGLVSPGGVGGAGDAAAVSARGGAGGWGCGGGCGWRGAVGTGWFAFAGEETTT